MKETSYVAAVAPATIAVVRAVTPDRLDAPTPCAEWTVGQLFDHLLHWGPALEGAARKEDVPPGPAGHGVEEQFDRLAAAWSDPAAWAGVARLGSPQDMPAATIGGMVLSEFVVHGWDLARAVGLRPEWPDGPLGFLHDETLKMAAMGRDMGVYGPPVPVPDDAPVLDRILGLTGRDPHWTPCP